MSIFDQTFATEVSPAKKVYPIERLGASYALDQAEVALRSDGTLWVLQQAIARARVQMLQKMIQADLKPVNGRDRCTIRVELERSVIAGFDYDGPIDVPPFAHHLIAMQWSA